MPLALCETISFSFPGLSWSESRQLAHFLSFFSFPFYPLSLLFLRRSFNVFLKFSFKKIPLSTLLVPGSGEVSWWPAQPSTGAGVEDFTTGHCTPPHPGLQGPEQLISSSHSQPLLYNQAPSHPRAFAQAHPSNCTAFPQPQDFRTSEKMSPQGQPPSGTTPLPHHPRSLPLLPSWGNA